MEWIITLIAIALLLYFFEIFVPGGILFVLGVVLMLAATGLGFRDYGASGAAIVFLVCAGLSVLMVFLELKYLPHLPGARKLYLASRIEGGSLKPQAESATLVGQSGRTLTTLAPTGTVAIDGRSYEAFSQSGMLQEGTPVEVVSVDPFRIIVRKK